MKCGIEPTVRQDRADKGAGLRDGPLDAAAKVTEADEEVENRTLLLRKGREQLRPHTQRAVNRNNNSIPVPKKSEPSFCSDCQGSRRSP